MEVFVREHWSLQSTLHSGPQARPAWIWKIPKDGEGLHWASETLPTFNSAWLHSVPSIPVLSCPPSPVLTVTTPRRLLQPALPQREALCASPMHVPSQQNQHTFPGSDWGWAGSFRRWALPCACPRGTGMLWNLPRSAAESFVLLLLMHSSKTDARNVSCHCFHCLPIISGGVSARNSWNVIKMGFFPCSCCFLSSTFTSVRSEQTFDALP